jgi:hypothetical protein
MPNFSLHLLADVQPGPGIGPLPIQRALRKPYRLGNFLIAQAAEEFQRDNRKSDAVRKARYRRRRISPGRSCNARALVSGEVRLAISIEK